MSKYGNENRGHIVLVLHISVQVGEAGDFGLQHQRFHLPVESEVAALHGCRRSASSRKPFDLYLADELAHPLPGAWPLWS